MAKTGFVIPILPGKEELATKGQVEEIRRRMPDYEQSRKNAGIFLERLFLQPNPDGSNLIVVYSELEGSFEDVARAFTTSDSEFDRWFLSVTQEISGIDFSKPVPGGPPEHLGSWEAPDSPRGKGLAFASPIVAGKTDTLRALAKQAVEQHRAEWSESRTALGLTRTEVFLNHTPQGDVAVTYIEGADPIRSNQRFAASNEPFDRSFKDGLKEIFPPFVDFDQPVPANETLWDWSRS